MTNRCLNERELLALYTREETSKAQSHVRECADCRERYESLVADLQTIGRVLDAPPPAWEDRPASVWRMPWIPVAVGAAAILLLMLNVSSMHQSPSLRAAWNGSPVSAFTTDLSDALFATGDANAVPEMFTDASYLDAALDAGSSCTRERFMSGDCDDQLSALMIESD
ncbi:MAG TPA: hypothetical protein VMW17_14950 [Candidatus Binatia bacterium]|nr:hypothetical protein [Candidatus Binatia bacterium]